MSSDDEIDGIPDNQPMIDTGSLNDWPEVNDTDYSDTEFTGNSSAFYASALYYGFMSAP
jgi:hypothetical protein